MQGERGARVCSGAAGNGVYERSRARREGLHPLAVVDDKTFDFGEVSSEAGK